MSYPVDLAAERDGELLKHLDELERLLRCDRRLLLARRTLVDTAAVLGVLEQIRVSLPTELARARQLLAEREALLADARAEAEHLVWRAEQAAAEQRRDQLLAEVGARVTHIEERALHRAAETRRSADQHAAEVLRWLRTQLAEVARVIDRARVEPLAGGAPGESGGDRA